MTVPGKGGRPKGERFRWLPSLWVSAEERQRIERAAEARGESVAGFVLRAALDEARRVLGSE